MEGSNTLTLRQIGSFIGERIREIHEALTARATKVELKEAVDSVARSYAFSETLNLVVEHNSSRTPVAVSVIDLEGRVHHAHWQVLDANRFSVSFTEVVSGRCNVIFAS